MPLTLTFLYCSSEIFDCWFGLLAWLYESEFWRLICHEMGVFTNFSLIFSDILMTVRSLTFSLSDFIL